MSGGLAAGNPNSLDKFVRNANVLADIDVRVVSAYLVCSVRGLRLHVEERECQCITRLGESRLWALEHPGSAAELCPPSVSPLPARARHGGMAKLAHSLAASALRREVD